MKRNGIVAICSIGIAGMCLAQTPITRPAQPVVVTVGKERGTAAGIERRLRATRINLQFDDVPAGNALDYIGCEKTSDGGIINYVLMISDPAERKALREQRTVSLNLNDVTLYDTIRYLSRLLGLQFLIEDNAVLLYRTDADLPSDTRTELAAKKELAQPILPAASEQARRQEENSRPTAISMNNMRQLLMGIRMYEMLNAALPKELSDLKSHFGVPIENMLRNPRTGATPGYEYVRPETDEFDRGTAAVLFERMPDGTRAVGGAVGYADGHVKPPVKATHVTQPANAMPEPAPTAPAGR